MPPARPRVPRCATNGPAELGVRACADASADQGAGAIVDGAAEVVLDPNFVAAVSDVYQVQLTPYAPVLLWVAARGKDRFTVRAQALPATKLRRGRIGFSWRVIARRGDLARARRFAEVTLPELGRLPEVPEAPKAPRLPSASPALKVQLPKANPFGERLATAKDLANRAGSPGRRPPKRRSAG